MFFYYLLSYGLMQSSFYELKLPMNESYKIGHFFFFRCLYSFYRCLQLYCASIVVIIIVSFKGLRISVYEEFCRLSKDLKIIYAAVSHHSAKAVRIYASVKNLGGVQSAYGLVNGTMFRKTLFLSKLFQT